MTKTKEQLIARQREINDKLSEMQSREMNAEMQAEMDVLVREYNNNKREIEVLNMAREAQPEEKSAQVRMRETLKGARTGEVREIIVGTSDNPGAGLHSGAIPLTIKELLPNLEEGTGLPDNCPIVGGVIGDVVFPTDASDMEMKEVGEIATVSDQVIDFDNIKAAPSRITLGCDVSNKLIDNLNFDILAHISKKYQKAWRTYWATKIYSQANWSGVKGPWANATIGAGDSITIGGDAAKNILEKLAAFLNKGLSADDVCFVLGAADEAKLKATPIAIGQGGFVIQEGKLLGYPYVVTHYINTVLGGDSKTSSSHTDTSKLYATTKNYLGIGFFNYLKPQQHGEIRLGMDGQSKAQMAKNCVGVVFNTEVSLTDLSKKLYDQEGNVVSAFGIYELSYDNAPSPASVLNVKVVNTAASPVKVAGSVTVDNSAESPVQVAGAVSANITNTTEAPVNTKEVTA